MSSYFSRLGTIAPVAAVYDRRSRASNDYVYDSLNRLQRAYMTNHYSQRYNYGRYGNMACAPGSNYCNTTITFDVGTNQINTTDGSGNRIYLYDAAGNLTQDGTGRGPGSLTHSFQWDAEGRLKLVDSGATASFVYNALGQRVEKQVGSAYTETLYDAFGNVSGYHNRSAWVQDFIPVGSRIFAKYQDGATYFLHPDRLGSTMYVTNHYGTTMQKLTYYPWGQTWASAGTLKDIRFASMEQRDAETGNDHTWSRQYASNLGRWLSPDRVAGSVLNPQSLNRYAYVLNNPTNLIDPLGSQTCQSNDPTCQGHTDMGMVMYSYYWSFYAAGLDLRNEFEMMLEAVESAESSTATTYSYQFETVNTTVSDVTWIQDPDTGLWIAYPSLMPPSEVSWMPVGVVIGTPGRVPDFWQFAINVGPWYGATFTVSVDRYKHVYVAPGVNIGKSLTPISGSVSYGWTGPWNELPTSPTPPEPNALKGFLTKGGCSAGGTLGGGIFFGWSGGGQAWMPSVGTPQAGISCGYGFKVR